MKRWLALAFLGLGVIWGPYVYSELASEPAKASGKQRGGLRLFGSEDEDEAAEAPEDLPAEAPGAEPAAETAKADKPEDKPAADPAQAAPEADKTKATGAPVDEAKPKDPSAKAEAPEGESERPTLPSELLPAFRKVFDVEPRDSFWANDEEGKLRALFNEAGATPDALGELSCRKTVCRIALTPDEFEQEALEKLYAALRARHRDKLALDHAHDAVGQRGTLFVLRDGYELEH